MTYDLTPVRGHNTKRTSKRFLNNSSKVNILIYDTETTGIAPDDRIMQIAIYNVKTDESYQQYINPEISMKKKASEITGITDDFLKNKPIFSKIVNNFEDFIFKNTKKNDITLLIAHNNNFDESKLRKEYGFIEKDFIKNIIFVDTLDLFRMWIHKKDIKFNDHGRPVKGTYKLSTGKFDDPEIIGNDLYQRFMGHAFENAHNAITDIIALWDITKALFRYSFNRDDIQFITYILVLYTYHSELNDPEYMSHLL